MIFLGENIATTAQFALLRGHVFLIEYWYSMTVAVTSYEIVLNLAASLQMNP